jgi:beta-lactam-binding protein with PASTA domain
VRDSVKGKPKEQARPGAAGRSGDSARQVESGKLGQTLREAREAKGATLNQAEAVTRVRGKYLRALEEADWGSLPEPLYVKGFLRSYARYLGLDALTVLAQYDRLAAGPRVKPVVRQAVSPLKLGANAWTGLIIGLLVFGAFAVGLLYIYRQYSASFVPPTPVAILPIPTPPPTATATPLPVLQVTVPDMVNRELSVVELELRALGVKLEVGDRRFDTRIAVGRVITQSTPAGIKLQQGATITVTLSKGSEVVTVPNVVNIGFDQARGILSNAGFAVSRKDEPSAQAAAGIVFRQEPPPQSAAAPGSAVVVYVSQGGAPPIAGKVTVPNVVGRPWAEAEKTLLAAGLRIRGVQQQDFDFVPRGSVLSTTPPAGTLVDPGSGIDVGVRRE